MNRALKQAEQAWEAIARDLSQQSELPDQVSQIAQRVILVTLCLAIGEGLNIFPLGQLQHLSEQTNLHARLAQLWQSMGGFSHFWIDPFGADLTLDDALLRDLFRGLAQLTSGAAIPIETLGQVHELFLGDKLGARKLSGAYYTPGAIARYIVHNTVGHLLESGANRNQPLRILDPACGGGIFLLTAYQRLLEGKSLTQAARTQILLDCIHGVDIDPQAVEVTHLSLLLKLLESVPNPDLSQLPDLSRTIQLGNALIEQDVLPLNAAQLHPLDWQMAFPQVMQSGGFEVVIGNPPYIDSETMTRWLPQCRQYCTTHYQSAVGNWDLFCVFIERALQLCKTGGLSSLIVPNKLLSANYASGARSLLCHNRLLSIRDYSQVPVFGVAIYPLVYVVQKGSPTDLPIRYELMQSVEEVARSHFVSQSTISENINTQNTSSQNIDTQATSSQNIDTQNIDTQTVSSHPNPQTTGVTQSASALPWLIAVQPQQADLVVRLRKFPLLGAIAQITGAATVAEAYAIQPLIQENSSPQADDLRLVNSGTLDRYCLLWGKKRLRYLGNSYLHPVIPAAMRQHLPKKREQQAIAQKILVAGMTKVLECALDSTGTVLAGKSTSVIRAAIDLRYLLGILNSKLISFYFTNSFASNSLQGGYLRIGPPQLQQIPICLENGSEISKMSQEHQESEKSKQGGDRHSQLIHLVDQLLLGWSQQGMKQTKEPQALQTSLDGLEQHIDQLVCQLYGLTDAETEMVLTHRQSANYKALSKFSLTT
jgi:hypothetical protein